MEQMQWLEQQRRRRSRWHGAGLTWEGEASDRLIRLGRGAGARAGLDGASPTGGGGRGGEYRTDMRRVSI